MECGRMSRHLRAYEANKKRLRLHPITKAILYRVYELPTRRYMSRELHALSRLK